MKLSIKKYDLIAERIESSKNAKWKWSIFENGEEVKVGTANGMSDAQSKAESALFDSLIDDSKLKP